LIAFEIWATTRSFHGSNRRELVQHFHDMDGDGPARRRFDELVREYPDVYFELEKVVFEKTLLAFTPIDPLTLRPSPPVFNS